MKSLALLLTILFALSTYAADLVLVWNASAAADETTSYNIYVSTGDTAPFSIFATTTNTTFTITNIVPGRFLIYVTATNLWGESLPSNTVKTPPGKPGPVTLTITKK